MLKEGSMNSLPGVFAATLMVLFALALAFSQPAAAEAAASQAEIEKKLRELEEELSKYKEMLESTETEKSGLEENLKQNEKGISDLINKIDGIEKELRQNEDKISQLTGEQKELLARKSEQQYYIERQIRAAYEIGDQEYLKVLLNQEDPNEIARMLTYYDYFNEARASQIEKYNSVMRDLDRVSLALAFQTRSLKDNRQRLVDQKTALAVTQAERKKTLAALITQIRTTGSEITRLEKDRGRLEQLLDKLHQSLANLPAPADAEPFSGMQGKLVMPVSGDIAHRFGHRRNEGKLRWHGVFIDAEEGEPVHAVHYGRVVFSDWLRGFGLLMIISHGEGYMSLYGHNQVLYRETGDWVGAGEVIATVGDSGGQNRSGLYFEIRIAGKPSDPQKWCIAREQRAA